MKNKNAVSRDVFNGKHKTSSTAKFIISSSNTNEWIIFIKSKKETPKVKISFVINSFSNRVVMKRDKLQVANLVLKFYHIHVIALSIKKFDNVAFQIIRSCVFMYREFLVHCWISVGLEACYFPPFSWGFFVGNWVHHKNWLWRPS